MGIEVAKQKWMLKPGGGFGPAQEGFRGVGMPAIVCKEIEND